MCNNTTKGTARVEEKLSSKIEKKSKGTLWQRNARGSTPIGIRVVHK